MSGMLLGNDLDTLSFRGLDGFCFQLLEYHVDSLELLVSLAGSSRIAGISSMNVTQSFSFSARSDFNFVSGRVPIP